MLIIYKLSFFNIFSDLYYEIIVTFIAIYFHLTLQSGLENKIDSSQPANYIGNQYNILTCGLESPEKYIGALVTGQLVTEVYGSL